MVSNLRSDQMIIFTRVFFLNLLLFCLVSSAEDLIPFKNKSLGLWGYRSQKTGDIVIDTKYYEIGSFRNELSSSSFNLTKILAKGCLTFIPLLLLDERPRLDICIASLIALDKS